MFLNILIVSVILVAFSMLALGVKLLFNKEASFTEHACAMGDGDLNQVGGCAGCDIQELSHCTEAEK